MTQPVERFKAIVNPVTFSAVLDINDEIYSPSQFEDHIDTLSSLTENDSVLLRICSGGGAISATNTLLSAIKQCPAFITAEITGQCCSAATLIFLSADNHIVNEDTEFMIHNGSMGCVAKTSDWHSYSDFAKEHSKRLFKHYYTDFLTEDEIVGVIRGDDIWLHKEEVEERLARKFPQNYQEPLTEEDLQAMSKEQLIALLTGQEISEEIEEELEVIEEDRSALEIVQFGTIDALKELADMLEIKYAHNISLSKLRERVKVTLGDNK